MQHTSHRKSDEMYAAAQGKTRSSMNDRRSCHPQKSMHLSEENQDLVAKAGLAISTHHRWHPHPHAGATGLTTPVSISVFRLSQTLLLHSTNRLSSEKRN